MAGTDYVMVQLTAAGVALAGGHPLGLRGGNRTFEFAPGVPVRAEKAFEWNAVLSKQTTMQGLPLFEIVPGSAQPAPAASATFVRPAIVPQASAQIHEVAQQPVVVRQTVPAAAPAAVATATPAVPVPVPPATPATQEKK